ncbi:enoyl-CoA hydratase-related protein [uncultured Desulfobacter sp.]|uniref:enoyl-CoA hydratase/isomerase family protein n=1 Tax=uncultured Desulfobacter sp. TaxID=240139 RepID=UPI002AA92A5B|nr:enoyl-CoA hydratase-related protein [uncultured Desulfobacter sp.]
MAYETIITQTLEGHVATVTLNRAEAMNTFSSQMAEELYDALNVFEVACDVRVILIKGAGRAFCAGIDVNELKGKTTNQYREWIEKMEAPLVLISKMHTPVIAQVHGAAAANGMGLVAASDLAIAADNVKMGLTAINVGLNCVGPVIPVARCVGQKKALELLLYGELIKADQALALGLINRIVPKDELDEAALAWARDLAKKSPMAVKIAKSAFYASRDMPYEAQFAYMNEAFARLCDTNDAKEGVAAFFEKRPPVWQEK